MPKRKSTEIHEKIERSMYNKDEIMVETVHLVLTYNLYRKKASNDMTLIEYAKKLNVEELRCFNSKLKDILSHIK